jgi:hypothetical protein
MLGLTTHLVSLFALVVADRRHSVSIGRYNVSSRSRAPFAAHKGAPGCRVRGAATRISVAEKNKNYFLLSADFKPPNSRN